MNVFKRIFERIGPRAGGGRPARAIVSLGSNIEPRAAYLERALAEIAAYPGAGRMRISPVIETRGVDVPADAADRLFLNQIALCETTLTAEAFARHLHETEARLGRVREVFHGPRTIDLDLVDFDGMVLDTPELTLPHPRARERDFVLDPLAAVGINWRRTPRRREAWVRLLRLPNLPTAPGDALAGAALAATLGAAHPAPWTVACVGLSALFFYVYGLVDNDLAGAWRDRIDAPERPLPAGTLSFRTVRAVRATAWGLALLAGACAGFPPLWWLFAGFLLAAIVVYNRWSTVWGMGLCRALNLLCGAAALWPATAACPLSAVLAIGLAAAGWMAYVAAVTRLSQGEERAHEPLGAGRYLWGLSAFLPLAGLWAANIPPALPAAGCLFMFVAWCQAVAPLGTVHDPLARRTAVGRTVGALLYVQVGFMLAQPSPIFLCAALVLWVAARLVRRAFSVHHGS
jgi:2-amino-4-hydroxy-6-hydroxymethyldihydropteridine diphosphokinase